MRTKIVYVLVSQESDYYYEMFLLSHYSLRLHHPKGDAEVVLVMDTDTHQRLVDKKAPVLDDVTPVVVSIPEEYTIMQRSRYLKTSLRQRIEGGFLYVDCDTIICEPIDDIDILNENIAMLPERMTGGWMKNFEKVNLGHLKDTAFYNSGIIYAKEAPDVYKLFEVWHASWKSYLHLGINLDQPALCEAIQETHCNIKKLSYIWNYFLEKAETDINPQAKIFHYLSYDNGIARHLLFSEIRQKGIANNIAVERVVKNPFTIGCHIFSINKEQMIGYLFSDILGTYSSAPPIFKFFLFLSHVTVKPVRFLSLLKHNIARAWNW